MRVLRMLSLVLVLVVFPTGCDSLGLWFLDQILPGIVRIVPFVDPPVEPRPAPTPVPPPPPEPAPVPPPPEPEPAPEPATRGVGGLGCVYGAYGGSLIECNAFQAGDGEDLEVFWQVNGVIQLHYRTNVRNLIFNYRPSASGTHVINMHARSLADGRVWESTQAVEVVLPGADDGGEADDCTTSGGFSLLCIEPEAD